MKEKLEKLLAIINEDLEKSMQLCNAAKNRGHDNRRLLALGQIEAYESVVMRLENMISEA